MSSIASRKCVCCHVMSAIPGSKYCMICHVTGLSDAHMLAADKAELNPLGTRSRLMTESDSAIVAPARRPHDDTPERWQSALQRALTEHVTVREGSDDEPGLWWASSPRSAMVYRLVVRGNVVISCQCAAGQGSDPVCKHRAAYYARIGALTQPTSELITQVITPDDPCPICHGGGVVYVRDCEVAGWPHPTCNACRGTGVARHPRPRER